MGDNGRYKYNAEIPKVFCRVENANNPLPPDHTNADHSVLVEKPISLRISAPHSTPLEFVDSWDANHVRLPCSPKNFYCVVEGDQKENRSRWDLIKKALEGSMRNSYAIERCVLTYNSRYSSLWDFSGLHNFFRDHLTPEERCLINDKTLPAICQLALKLPSLCTQPIPLLRAQQSHSVTMSQEQAACLLANAFLCTFPRRNTIERESEYEKFPRINFTPLFSGHRGKCSSLKAAKLKCLFHYFYRVAVEKTPVGVLTFERKVSKSSPVWEERTEKLGNCVFFKTGKIEDEGKDFIMLDFANKSIGGGVLGRGAVQEEILFMIYPELLVSRLICEELTDNESLVIRGCERFSSYTGYGNTFSWSKPYIETRERDVWGRLPTEVLAIDAYVMSNFEMQLHDKYLYRELNKAHCGFLCSRAAGGPRAAFATGNWGCGAFGGDPVVKAIIQLMAAAVCGRDLVYYTFGDEKLLRSLKLLYDLLKERATVGEIWSGLFAFRRLKLERQRHETGYDSAGNPKILKFFREYFDELTPSESQNGSSSTLSSIQSSSIVFRNSDSDNTSVPM